MYIYTALELYLYFISKLTRAHVHINLENTNVATYVAINTFKHKKLDISQILLVKQI